MKPIPTQLRLKMVSDPATLAGVRQAVEGFCADHGFDKKTCDEVGLCVNEALANVIRHAYDGQADRPIEMCAECTNGEVAISIRDWGKGVNPDELPARSRSPLQPGGLGLVCLKRMMENVTFQPQADGMLLRMTRHK